LVVLVLCNFAQGFKQFLDLSLLTLYKDNMGMSPGEVEFCMGLIAIPWSLKIIYGFMADNLKVFNSRRRGHIMANCMVCISAMALIVLFGEKFPSWAITLCIFVSQMNMAYNDTITDALTVQAAKFGVEDGNENLNSISYLMQGIGAICGGLISMKANDFKLNPYHTFIIYLVLQAVFLVSACMMNSSMEPGEIVET
jgi:MFS family permease